jgi:hypothetical protein
MVKLENAKNIESLFLCISEERHTLQKGPLVYKFGIVLML